MKTVLEKFDSIIFDLDGTLWDASITSAKAWNLAAGELKLISNFSPEDIRKVSGLPFEQCIETRFGLTYARDQNIIEMINNFEMDQIKQFGGTLYPGVEEGLSRLSKDTKLFLISNCQSWYLRTFLEKSGLSPLFENVLCHGDTALSKTQNIKKIIKEYNLKSSLYIGDTHWDQESAYFARSKFLFASYGFGKPRVSCPSVESFGELLNFLYAPQPQLDLEIRKLQYNEHPLAFDFYDRVGYSPHPNKQDMYFAAFNHNKMIGLVRLAFEHNQWVLRGMQILPQFQFYGIGTKLIQLLAEDLENKTCFCMPHGWLDKFYFQIGFKKIEDLNLAPIFLQERLKENLLKYPQLMLMRRDAI